MINFFYFGDFEEVMDFVGDVLRDSEALLHHLVTLEIVSENCKEKVMKTMTMTKRAILWPETM